LKNKRPTWCHNLLPMWWYNRKVAAPDDGCNNVRNILSIEDGK